MRTQTLPDKILRRTAAIYIRQSTRQQVEANTESKGRQYSLVDLAHDYGFKDVTVIDEDLGISGSGIERRPGFERLMQLICADKLGAVFCLEASRLARNGHQWHRLLEMCGWFEILLVDTQGIYDARQPNDRLLLGLKGSMSEFELDLIRDRLQEAVLRKARRGELRFTTPAGYLWPAGGDIELDPDARVQGAIRQIFDVFGAEGTARRTMRMLRADDNDFPAVRYLDGQRRSEWVPVTYRHVHSVLTNPFYAGAYVYGKRRYSIDVVDGRASRRIQTISSPDEWPICIRSNHPGYISWSQWERNQKKIAENNFVTTGKVRHRGRGGGALAAGLCRCGNCGRMLTVHYGGYQGKVARYACKAVSHQHGGKWCMSVGSRAIHDLISEQVLAVVQPHAIEAAKEAATLVERRREARQAQLDMELEDARYQSNLAARRYAAVDPDKRLVAAELESRWEAALQRVRRLEQNLDRPDAQDDRDIDLRVLAELADQLKEVWNHPETSDRRKKEIIRILIVEIRVTVDENAGEIDAVIHWKGGHHSEHRLKKLKPGAHKNTTDPKAMRLIEKYAGKESDASIADRLNRKGFVTGVGNAWNAGRVGSARRLRGIHGYASACGDGRFYTMIGAAEEFGVTYYLIRKLVFEGHLEAHQVVPSAPWQIPREAFEAPEVQAEFERFKNRRRWRTFNNNSTE